MQNGVYSSCMLLLILFNYLKLRWEISVDLEKAREREEHAFVHK